MAPVSRLILWTSMIPPGASVLEGYSGALVPESCTLHSPGRRRKMGIDLTAPDADPWWSGGYGAAESAGISVTRT